MLTFAWYPPKKKCTRSSWKLLQAFYPSSVEMNAAHVISSTIQLEPDSPREERKRAGMRTMLIQF